MRNKLLAVVLISTIAFPPAYAVPPRKASGTPDRAPAAAVRNEAVRVVSDDGRSATDTLVGDAARAHLDALRARKPEAFAKADAILEAKGYKRTPIVVVRRTVSLQAKGIQPVQTYSNEDGEMVFVSWDDGDNGTWEGEIYVTNYSTGASILVDGQILISDTSLPVTWERTVSYQGSDPRMIAPEARNLRPNGRTDAVQVASADAGFIERARTQALANDIQLVQSRGYLTRWAYCAAGGCLGALYGCRAAGPGWAHCTAIACLAIMIGCAISEL